MSQDALKYLQQDDIGKVIAKGLASLYTHKPQKPVKYLAEWLKSYSKNKKQLANVVKEQKLKKDSLKLFEQTINLNALRDQQDKRQAKQRDGKIDEFKRMIANHEYPQELLQQVLPEFVEKHTNITGAYIGELNHPPRQVNDQDTDELAHLNTGADKVINYIGSSVSHKSLMRGKILSLNQGVTANAFSLAQENSAPVVGEDGQEIPQPTKQKYVYIPNVVKNQAMHYFKIPKLGAYLAIPLVCQSFLTQKIFDEALAAKKKQMAQQQQFNKKQHEQLEQLNKNKQQLQKKIHDMKQKHVDEAQIQPINNELNELLNKIKDKQQQKYVVEQSPLSVTKNSYVFCVDNLGKDKQLDAKDIALIHDLINHFKSSWETKQKLLLAKDIDTQIQQLKTLPSPPENIKQQLEKVTNLDEEATKQINSIQDQKLKAYKLQQQQFKKLKAEIKNNKIFLQSFLKIKQFRVVKFKQVIQNILYFLGETKNKINLPRKVILNWKSIKQQYITKQTFNNILNYVVQGPKSTAFKFYGKTPQLLKIFQKFNQDQIFAYNVGLGALVKFIKKALKHRISNVELRKSQRQVERQQRQALIKSNEEIDAQQVASLDEYKKSLTPEEFQAFKQEEWISKFETEHPKKQVPPEVIDDIDNDI